MKIKQFTDSGIQKFRQYYEARITGSSIPPMNRVDSPTSDYTAMVDGYADVEIDPFLPVTDKSSIPRHLVEQLGDRLNYLSSNSGFWTWLIWVYRNHLLPEGRTPAKTLAFYVFDPKDWNRKYKHLLAYPTILFKKYGDSPLMTLLLSSKPHEVGELWENVVGRQAVMASEGFCNMLPMVYLSGGNILRVARGQGPYSIRRMTNAAFARYDFTYDLQSMSASQVFDLLPEDWKNLSKKDF